MADKPKIAKAQHFQIASKEREYLIANLALLLKAAVPIGEALQSLAETGRTKQFKKAILHMQHDIDNGVPLWEALDRAGLASGQTLALIHLGEQSGNLVDNLQVAAKQEEKQRIFQAKIRSALLYPGFVLGLITVVGLGVSWFLLPKLSETFAQLDVELPLISKIFINFGVFLKANGLWAVPSALAILALTVIVLFALPKTKGLGKRLTFHLPGIKKLMYEVEVARFGYLLGTLLRAGLSVTQALDLLHDASSAPRHKQLYRTIRLDFDQGYSFKSSFSRHKREANKLLPPAVQQMIIAAERSGALADTLVSVGDIYESKADVSTKNLETVLEPLLLVIVAAGVMLVAIAVIMPIYGLLGGLDDI